MATRYNDGEERIKPGANIKKSVWEKFREKYPENTSRELERLMEADLSTSNNTLMFLSSTPVQSISFDKAEDWSINMSSNMINVSRSMTSYNADSSPGVTYTSATSKMPDLKDIIIK